MSDVRLTNDPNSAIIGQTYKDSKANKNFPWVTKSIYNNSTRYFENEKAAVNYLLEKWVNNRLKSVG